LGVTLFGKDFRAIGHALLPDRPLYALIELYYLARGVAPRQAKRPLAPRLCSECSAHIRYQADATTCKRDGCGRVVCAQCCKAIGWDADAARKSIFWTCPTCIRSTIATLPPVAAIDRSCQICASCAQPPALCPGRRRYTLCIARRCRPFHLLRFVTSCDKRAM
jgi:hypothetical protein